MQYLSEKAGIGPCMDVKAHNGLLYAIQRKTAEHRGRLCVLRPDLSVVSGYEGVGNARQIEIVGDVAVITAREDGLWLFDVSGAEPVLLSHYQTVEYATGVALYGNLALISCRQYGVQILEISDPRRPVHIGLIRVGEVQSATVDGGILYCGVWGGMKVVVVDLRDPAHPAVMTEIPLQGRGDGLCVKDGVLYAATGQHAREIANVADRNDPAFGMGNGVERFDVTDPSRPVRLGGTRFERAFCESVDMWEAAVYGSTLVVNNSVVGVYGLKPESLETVFRLLPPPTEPADAVTGVTAVGGDLFAATYRGDLFAARGLGLGEQAPNRADVRTEAVPHPLECRVRGAEIAVVYGGSFPVLAAEANDSTVALACAEGGVHLLDRRTLELRGTIPTAGFAQDVRFSGSRLFVAEESGGVEIFDVKDFTATRIGGFTDNKPVYQIAVSESGRYLMCGLSVNEVKMYDVGDPSRAKAMYSCTMQRGPLYGNNFASGRLNDGTMVLFCHRDGLIFTNPERGDDRFEVREYLRKKGFCGYCAGEGVETDGERILYTNDGGYVFLSCGHADKTLIDGLPHHRAQEAFTGLLTMQDGLMAASHRCEGRIRLLDVRDLTAPKILATVETNASPAKALFVDGRILIPAGRAGLFELLR